MLSKLRKCKTCKHSRYMHSRFSISGKGCGICGACDRFRWFWRSR